MSNASPVQPQLLSRINEADQFYSTVIPQELTKDAKNIMRQALGGMLWNKQYYHYDVARWLRGDPVPRPHSQEGHAAGKGAPGGG